MWVYLTRIPQGATASPQPMFVSTGSIEYVTRDSAGVNTLVVMRNGHTEAVSETLDGVLQALQSPSPTIAEAHKIWLDKK